MGGTKEKETQFIPAPQQPAAPSASETSAQMFESQLKYNPQLYEQYMKSYAQYLPQMAGVELGVQQEYAPLLKALQEQMYPQQTQLTEALSGQALQRLQSPYGYSTSEQAALDAMRQRQREQLQEQIRTRAQLGGGLYGGRAERREEQALTELEQAFTEQDISRYLMGGQQALQYTTPILQMQYPQVSQPQMPQYWQGVTPSADQIYRAMYESSRVPYAIQPGQPAQPSPLWGMMGQAAGGAGSIAAAKMLVACLAEDTEIITKKKIKDIEIGDYILTDNGFKEVKKTFKYDKSPTMKLQRLECTEFHPIVTSEGLKLSGQFKEKKSIQSNKKVHNLEVKGHKFYANGILVHDGREV